VEGKGYLSSEVGGLKEGSHEWGSRTFGVSAGMVNHAVVEESEVSQSFAGSRPCGEKRGRFGVGESAGIVSEHASE
jgi:hypothetical protein